MAVRSMSTIRPISESRKSKMADIKHGVHVKLIDVIGISDAIYANTMFSRAGNSNALGGNFAPYKLK